MRPVSRGLCGIQFQVLQHRTFDRQTWFYRGALWRGIPRWAGYSLGFEIVGRYLALTRQRTSDIHAMPAAVVLKTVSASRPFAFTRAS
ncbi:MAG TPA: DUF2268 domain-containing putative Zn-dependent protease [Lacipirellulaceae bacterium]|nr:DUF2268 domain-containing putative Zn-dependent protease [Lacipirellulaceae bacterium]